MRAAPNHYRQLPPTAAAPNRYRQVAAENAAVVALAFLEARSTG
ncbi:MAG TPA: hypothetical protein VGB52_07370 [Actinomycetota bacterium]